MVTILEYLETTAARVPEKRAFYTDQSALSYAELLAVSRRIGSCLAAAVAPGQPVALLIGSRSLCSIPAIFGTLYAGCPYVPLDAAQPGDRLALILDRLRPAAILADEAGRKALEGMDTAPVIRYEDAATAPENAAALAAIRAGASGGDPMSILFTSGSTGIPKGSVQTHASYIRWTQATIAKYSLTPDVVFGNQSPFFYANSILELFPPVALGATVYLLPGNALSFPKKLIQSLNEQRITLLCMTPSSFISVANSGALTPGCAPGLRWGIMCGEVMPWPPLKAWMSATPGAGWWYFYGSTEMLSVAVGKIAREYGAGDRMPVGRPFEQVRILFLDDEGREAKPGEPGEMLVSSPWVAQSYVNSPERTAAAWVTDPLDRGDPLRYFRSGDMGCLDAEGQLTVLGRKDRQIKHRGYRMELDDVDAALACVPGWQEGCALFHKPSGKIFCFYTGPLSEKEVRASLKKSLSSYMLPDTYVHLEQMPRTATNKTDYRALEQMMP